MNDYYWVNERDYLYAWIDKFGSKKSLRKDTLQFTKDTLDVQMVKRRIKLEWTPAYAFVLLMISIKIFECQNEVTTMKEYFNWAKFEDMYDYKDILSLELELIVNIDWNVTHFDAGDAETFSNLRTDF